VYVCRTDGTRAVTSRGRVGLRKRVCNFFPSPPSSVQGRDGRSEGKIHRRLDRLDAIQTGARSNGDLDRRPRLISAGKGK
jgi:hypothetical protein